MEPVAVRGARACLEHVVERPEASSGVVEDPVQDDAHVACVCRVEQLAQGGVAAEHGVDMQIVVGVVAVVGWRGEDRIQVDG